MIGASIKEGKRSAMRKKMLCMSVLLLLLLTACGKTETQAAGNGTVQTVNTEEATTEAVGTEAEDLENVNVVFGWLPEDMTQSDCNMPGRYQTKYHDASGTQRFVLEVQSENGDVIAVSDTEEVQIGNFSGIAYTYQGEDIAYTTLTSAMVSGMFRMEAGDFVLEWEQSGYFLRLFGTVSQEELLKIAENVTVS
jgi:major membrane immunogen (membrane-anchored lipoprotein)